MKHLRPPCSARREGGVATVVFVIMVGVLLGFIGLAIDLARAYARQTELQGIADELALAAANKLDGTQSGIEAAYSAARNLNDASYYKQASNQMPDGMGDVLSFANRPDAPASEWVTYNALSPYADASGLLYAKVDMTAFAGRSGAKLRQLPQSFSAFLVHLPAPLEVFPQAVAGKLVSPTMPLAICAKSTTATDGFGLTGVTDLLANTNQKAPNGDGAWLMNPVDATPTDPNNKGNYNSTSHFGARYIKAFVCSGSVGIGQVAGRDVYLSTLTRLDQNGLDAATWLNSGRFGAPGCTAPPPPPAAGTQPVVNIPVLDCTKNPTADGRMRALGIVGFSMDPSKPATATSIPVTYIPASPTNNSAVLFK